MSHKQDSATWGDTIKAEEWNHSSFPHSNPLAVPLTSKIYPKSAKKPIPQKLAPAIRQNRAEQRGRENVSESKQALQLETPRKKHVLNI